MNGSFGPPGFQGPPPLPAPPAAPQAPAGASPAGLQTSAPSSSPPPSPPAAPPPPDGPRARPRPPLPVLAGVACAAVVLTGLLVAGQPEVRRAEAQSPDSYLADVQRVCDERARSVSRVGGPVYLQKSVQLTRAELKLMDGIKPPAAQRSLHAELKELRQNWLRQATRAARVVKTQPEYAQVELARLARAAARADARYEELGLVDCGLPQPGLS